MLLSTVFLVFILTPSTAIIAKVCTIVYLLEGLLEDVPPEKKNSDLMEQFFVFALMWAFGGPMVVDKSDDYRR